MTKMSGLVLENELVVLLDGKTHNVPRTHPYYQQIREAFRNRDEETVRHLIDLEKAVENYAQGKVTVRNGSVYYNGKALHGLLVNRILSMMDEGWDVQPMCKFLENLMENPSKHSVDQLYRWMEKAKLPITDDGYLIGYKAVRDDYGSIHASPDGSRIDNSPGQVVEMARNEVDDDPKNLCSAGLHFCSQNYLPFFGTGPGQRVVVVKINPRDVVSVPVDHDDAKARCCRYEVLHEIDDDRIGTLEKRSVYTTLQSQVFPDGETFEDFTDHMWNIADDLFPGMACDMYDQVFDDLDCVDIIQLFEEETGYDLRHLDPMSNKSTGRLNSVHELVQKAWTAMPGYAEPKDQNTFSNDWMTFEDAAKRLCGHCESPEKALQKRINRGSVRTHGFGPRPMVKAR